MRKLKKLIVAYEALCKAEQACAQVELATSPAKALNDAVVDTINSIKREVSFL